MRISDWSSDVCSSDLSPKARGMDPHEARLSDPAERAEEGKGNKALAFKNCRNILLRDITILQGGHFCLYALGCSGMTIDNLRVDTDRDGLDIDCCRDVKISNCTVNAHKDDAIVLKSSYAPKPKVMCEDVTIIGCKTSEIGRASCRERVCQYVEISVVAG